MTLMLCAILGRSKPRSIAPKSIVLNSRIRSLRCAVRAKGTISWLDLSYTLHDSKTRTWEKSELSSYNYPE